MYKYSLFILLFDNQPVEQLDLFGAMSTPPDIQAPNVSVVPCCKMFFASGTNSGRKCSMQVLPYTVGFNNQKKAIILISHA